MSFATDGFSAMMSFLLMRRKAADDKCNAAGLQLLAALHRSLRASRAPPRGALVGQPAVLRREKILGHRLAARCLAVPEHHQHDQLELLDRENRARGGKRALDHQLAGLRG